MAITKDLHLHLEMRILLATGRKAERMVRDAVKDINADVDGGSASALQCECEVLTQDLDIAAFTTPASLRRALATHTHTQHGNGNKYDLILVSGLCKADFSRLERELKIPVRLGPRNAYDIAETLKFADRIEFSARTPADVLLRMKREEDAKQLLQVLEVRAKDKFSLKGVKIGGNARMKVCAELVDATLMDNAEIQHRMEYFIESGADIVDVGVHIGANPEDVIRAVKAARSFAPELPISVDTMEPELILAGIDSGADMVLSLNSANIAAVGDAIARKDIAAVVVPDTDTDTNPNPGSGHSLSTLFTNINTAREMGIRRIIADPVLDAVGYGIGESLHRYYLFRLLDKCTPLFFGAGNVTELIDADSTGVNALLAGIASDIGADILFTPEYSAKARGSVKELRVASEMMMLAKARNSTPKDLGIDLLIMKEKRSKPVLRIDADSEAEVIEAKSTKRWRRDPAGSFEIGICEVGDRRKIYAKHLPSGIQIVGLNAKEVMDTILRQNMVSLLEHASYLSRELMKAELALYLGRSYEQDETLFKF